MIQLRLCATCGIQLCRRDRRAPEVGVAQIGVGQSGAGQVGLPQVGAGQVGIAQD